ncbi:hypothetical protein KEJ23_04385 [Candidatus Bathyarchaeota archaeon]|nr:hypothetical protein [Candidatus Bathyarchaeota archaeon]
MEELERGHTVTFTCEYRSATGQLQDPTETGHALAHVYRRDELIGELTCEQISEGKWRAKWTIPATASLEEYYVEWSWSDGDPIKGRYKFRVIHTGISK